VTRPRLVRAAVEMAAERPPPTAEELAKYWEHCTNVLAGQAVDVQQAWLEVLALLEGAGLLVRGEKVPPAVLRMDACIHALSKGPT
jgi:hypothetical protein